MADSKVNMQDQVNKICDDLYSKGEKISVRILLTYFEDIKSTSTIHKFYQVWKEELEANEKSLYDKLGFSSEFTQVFMREITRFSKEAESRYKAMRDNAVEQTATAIEDLEKVEDKLYKQAAVVEQQAKEIIELREQLKSSEAKYTAELDKQAETNEVLVSELRKQIDQFQSEANSSLKTIENLRTELAKSELVMDSNKEFVQEVREQQGQLQSDNKDLTTAVATLTAKLEGAKELNTSIQSRLDDFSHTKSELETQLSQVKTEKTGVETQLSSVNNELNKNRAVTENLNARLGGLEEVNKQRERYIVELESKLEQQG